MSLLNLLDRNALKIQITFDEFNTEIKKYEASARKYNISICLSNPQDLIRFLERKFSEFRTQSNRCFTEVTFKRNSQEFSIQQAERYMIEKLDMIKANHRNIKYR